MKQKTHLIVFLFISSLLSCHSITKSDHFTVGEQRFSTEDHFLAFANRMPDSALSLLKQDLTLNDTSAPIDFFKKSIIHAEILLQNNQDNEDSSIIINALQYFDSIYLSDSIGKHNRQRFLENQWWRARTYHVLGYENQSKYLFMDATQNYINSLNIIDQYFSNDSTIKINRLYGSLYSHLGGMFLDCNMYETAKQLYFSSLDKYLQTNDSVAIANTYRQLGNICFYLNDTKNPDTLFYYVQKSFPYMGTHEHPYVSTLYSLIVELHYAFYQSDSTFVNPFIGIDVLLQGKNYRFLMYKYLSCIYLLEGDYEAALTATLQQMESSDLKIKMDAFERIVTIYEKLGDTDKSLEYYKIYKQFQYQWSDIQRKSAGMEALYDDYEKHPPKPVVFKSTRNLWIFFGAVAVILIIATVSLSMKKRWKKMPQPKISQKKEAQERFDEKWNQFESSEICDTIKNRCPKALNLTVNSVVYSKNHLTEDEKEALRKTLDQFFDNFTEKWQHSYPTLSEVELEYCFLSVLKLSEIQKAALLGISYQGCISRRNRAMEKMNTKESLHIFLKQFIKSSL